MNNPIDNLISLAKMTAAPSGEGVISCPIMLTPEYAQALLDRNDGNRRLRLSRVDEMAAAMRDGKWRANGTTISLSNKSRMLDGQHRCTAVIQSGVTIPTILVIGLDDSYDVFSTIDQGGTRTVQDILETSGFADVNNNVIAAANILMQVTEGLDIVSRADRSAYVAEHFDEINPWVQWAVPLSQDSPLVSSGKLSRSGTKAVGGTALSALAIHMHRDGGDADVIQEFFRGVVDPFSLPAPTLRTLTDNRRNILEAVNRRVRNGNPLNRAGGGNAGRRLLGEFAVHITAYNRYLRDEPVKVIRPFKADDFRWLSDLPPVARGPKA